MTFGIIINDASLPFISADDCSMKLAVFFEIIHKTKIESILLNRANSSHGRWHSFVYSDGFQLGEWMNKIEDRDLSRIVKSVVSDIDCPDITHDSYIQNIMNSALFVLAKNQEIEVSSLGIASHVGAHTVSFQTNEIWKSNEIPIVKQWEESGTWRTEDHSVQNISTVQEIDRYLADVVSKKQLNKDYLKSLEKCNKEFPNTIFFDSALKNLKSGSVTVIDFPKVVEVLKKLDISIIDSNNLSELALNSGLSISEESEATMSNRRFARQRYFKNTTGEVVCCSAHVKNFPCGKRMHISVDYNLNKVSIGYFGNHLPTVRHPK